MCNNERLSMPRIRGVFIQKSEVRRAWLRYSRRLKLQACSHWAIMRVLYPLPGHRQLKRRPACALRSSIVTNITVSLPDELAQQAQTAGLLRPEAIERLLREAMRKNQVDQLFTTMSKLAVLDPALTEAEIDAEIAAARADRARRR